MTACPTVSRSTIHWMLSTICNIEQYAVLGQRRTLNIRPALCWGLYTIPQSSLYSAVRCSALNIKAGKSEVHDLKGKQITVAAPVSIACGPSHPIQFPFKNISEANSGILRCTCSMPHGHPSLFTAMSLALNGLSID